MYPNGELIQFLQWLIYENFAVTKCHQLMWIVASLASLAELTILRQAISWANGDKPFPEPMETFDAQ